MAGGVAAILCFRAELAALYRVLKNKKIKKYNITYEDDLAFADQGLSCPGKFLFSPGASQSARFRGLCNILDCRYRYKILLETIDQSDFNILSLDIDDNECFWRRVDNRLSEIENHTSIFNSGIPEDIKEAIKKDLAREKEIFGEFSDYEKSLYTDAAYSFHQLNVGKSIEKRVPDPVLDIVLENSKNSSLIIKKISIVPLASWAKAKAVPVPQNLPTFQAYYIPVDFSKSLCSAQLTDPIHLPQKAPIRLKICLQNYSKTLSAFNGNESLISILLHLGYSHFITPPIYLGVLS